MRLPKLSVSPQNREAFEKRLMLWGMLREIFGDWYEVGKVLGADKYVHGPRRIKKKRLKRYMLQAIMLDLHEETGLTWSL